MQEIPHVMRLPDARRIVTNYNRIQEVLLEYEMLFHSAWKKGIIAAAECENANLPNLVYS